MSIICGIYSIEGRPATEQQLDRLMHVDPTFGPDAEGRRLLGPVALGYRGLCTMDEQKSETQPGSDEAGDCWVVADARIDNRSELIDALGLAHLDSAGITDSLLVLKAYRKWGTDCAPQILGDFAFAVWDSQARTIFCARDALGIRPLFYAFDGRTFAFASFIRQLHQLAHFDASLDEEYVANFLARADCPCEETIYRGIRRLMAGSAVLLKDGVLKNIKYWDFDPDKVIQYRTDDQYEEHFRELFTKAVKARLRSTGQVAAELSGGLDSSSIVCMAQEIYRANGQHGRRVTVHTDLVESRKATETKWSNAVVSKYDLESVFRTVDTALWVPESAGKIHCWDEPTLKDLALPNLRGRGRSVSEQKIRVLLSGIGGDQVFLAGMAPYHLVDSFRGLRWRSLLKDIIRWQRVLGLPVAQIFLESCVKPMIYPNSMFTLLKPAVEVLPWVDQRFWRRSNMRDRLLHRQGFIPRRFRSPAQQRNYLNIMRSSAVVVQGYMMNAPVETRYPYLDRDLVEFALAIPMQQKLRP